VITKLSGQIVDSYDDPAFLAHAENAGMLGTEFLSPEQLDKLADRDFAVEIVENHRAHRKFPTYNAAITKVSCVYWAENKNKLPENIVKTAGYFLSAALTRHNLNVPPILSGFAPAPFSVKLAAAPTSTLLSVDAAARAVTQLIDNKMSKMSPEERTVTASTLNKVAKNELSKLAWDYLPKSTFGPHVEKAIESRKGLLKAAGDWTKLMALAGLASKRTELGPEKFASALHEFDKLAGYDTRYAGGLVDPFYACYGGFVRPQVQDQLEKSAQERRDATFVAELNLVKAADDAAGSVEQHLSALRKAYPKGTVAYTDARNDHRGFKPFGASHSTARELYFQ
jgi:hypothetical protein